MEEFDEEDAKRWIEGSMEKSCSVSTYLYYDLYFRCQKDDELFMRALRHFRKVYKLEYKVMSR